jgi:hypothetical protein
VIALIALFFALAGTGYAVARLPKNSVTTVQVKDHSLLLRDFKSGQVPRGPRGPQGDPGAPGAPGAKGDPGDPWTLNGQLPSGKSLTGVFGPAASALDAGDIIQETTTFGFNLLTNPIVHYIPAGATPPAECPGTINQPRAQPGHLCLYESHAENVASTCVFNPVNDACAASAVRGFGVVIAAAVPGDFWAQGSWAVTAP